MEREIQLPMGVVSGWCAPEFEPLLEAFVRNFTDRGELGASLALIQGPGSPTRCVLCIRVPKLPWRCVCIF